MKYVRARITLPDLETPLTTLAAADEIETVRLLAGGVRDSDTPTYSLAIDGSPDRVHELLKTDDDVLEWEISAADQDELYVYVRFHAPPAVSHFREQFTRDSLVVLLPATFHPDSIELTVVGTQSDLSVAFETLPDAFDHTVLEVGTYRDGTRRGRSLTDRQREVIEIAFDLGYYDEPSRTSHEEIADELGCSASTVGEHLRKAERRLVAEVVT